MDLSIWAGVKSSRSKGLQSFDSMNTCHYEQIKGLICEVIQPLDYGNIKKRARQNFTVMTKTAGLPRSQDSLLPRNDMGKKAAFTLAEVLITLGIIGVVVAMTLPALIQTDGWQIKDDYPW